MRGGEALEAMVASEVRLEHAFLYVRDVERSLAFYRRLFPGWTIRWDGGGFGRRWVHWGPPDDVKSGYLSLCEVGDPTAQRPPDGSIGVDHVGFTHPDIAGLVARLAASGIDASERTEDERFRRVYFKDPDGHKLEFVQQLD
jgi:catechol 2,3-dioxygenase-like lactoylglutathione lyase family enzyme